MLSRVAERVYWAGRYLERAEDVARLIDVHTQLMLDLPKSAGISWKLALQVIGVPLPRRKGEVGERELLKLLLTDEESPGSLITAVGQARENFRTTRDIIPTEAWQSVNELHLFVKSELRWAVSQRRRHEILSEIIGRIQQIRGLLNDTMSHGEAFLFMGIGTHLERADMCTRIIDVAVASLMQNKETLQPWDNTLWMGTLRSVSGYQMYHQYVRRRIRGADVLSFLFQNAEFPRSVRHCLLELEHCLDGLPRGKPVMQKLHEVSEAVAALDVAGMSNAALHAEVDRLQLALADLNQQMTDTWFKPEELSRRK